MGVDLSYVNEIEDFGGVYRDSNRIKDPYQLFADRGANTVRVRLWHTPTWVATVANGKMYSDLADVERTIRRAKAAGMAVNLDLHYSDDWADPQKQEVPLAWKNLDLETLQDSVYRYTLGVLTYLKSQNLTPEMIQIGNETNFGMMHPLGKTNEDDFRQFGALVNSGTRAVRDFSKHSRIKPQVIIHCAQLQFVEKWMQNMILSGGVTDYDIIGLSHYPKWSTLTTMQEIGDVIQKLNDTYHKKVMIVEAGFPFTSKNADGYDNFVSGALGMGTYGVSEAEQRRYMIDLTQTVIDHGGLGVQYWEPAWITSPLRDRWGTGSSWENNAFFDFGGNTLPVFDFMTHRYKF